MLNINRHHLLFFLLGAVFYLLSMTLLVNYTGGDQLYYSRFYDELKGLNLFQVMPTASLHIDASEPIHPYLVWFGAQMGIDKNVYVSILNVILVLGILFFLRRHRAPWYFSLLLLTNFYVFVLMTGAERLKIAYILLVWSLVVPAKLAPVFFIASPLAHLQSLLFFPSVLLLKLQILLSGPTYSRILISRAKLITVMGIMIVLSFITLYFLEAILRKASFYMVGYVDLSNARNILALLILGGLVSKSSARVMISLFPLLVAAVFLGDARVNIMAFSLFAYFMIIERRCSHPLVLIILGFFSVKSVPFISNILKYGDGFSGPLI